MKKTILTILTTVALTFGATTLYHNHNVDNLNKLHQIEIEHVTDSLNNVHRDNIDNICLDILDNFYDRYRESYLSRESDKQNFLITQFVSNAIIKAKEDNANNKQTKEED